MPHWQLEFDKSAERDLKTLEISLRRRIIEKLDWLIKNLGDFAPIPLGGSWKGFFKLRIGDWRVIYRLNTLQRLIIVCYIDHRDSIYKRK